ncbi:acyl-CoA dehydrogenase family protein [Flindersiella endophytica]
MHRSALLPSFHRVVPGPPPEADEDLAGGPAGIYALVRRTARVDPAGALLLGRDVDGLGRRLRFVSLYVGVAEGALLAVRDGTDRAAAGDPYVLSQYGELAAHLQAASALVEQAVAGLAWALSRGARLTEQERGNLSALIESAEIVSEQVALEATAQILDITGERAARLRPRLDRFWQSVRAHDAGSYQRQEALGRFFLTDKTDEAPLTVSLP